MPLFSEQLNYRNLLTKGVERLQEADIKLTENSNNILDIKIDKLFDTNNQNHVNKFVDQYLKHYRS